MTKTDSSIIKELRFPLTFIVVMQHCMGNVYYGFDWADLSGADYYNIVKLAFSGIIALIGVPAFFFISGYLFFNKVTQYDLGVYKKKLKSRFQSLMIPYLLWPIIIIPMVIAVMWIKIKFTGAEGSISDYLASIDIKHMFWDHQRSLTEQVNLLGMQTLKTKPLMGTFWFVRDLIIMALLSPLVYLFVHRLRIWGIAILGALFLLRVWPHICLSSSSVFFFTLGAYLSLNDKSLYLENKTARYAIYLITAVAFVVTLILCGTSPYWCYQADPLFTLAGTLATVNIAYEYTKRGQSLFNRPLLSNSSFFVYALHHDVALPLGFFAGKMLFMHTTNAWLLCLQYFAVPIIIYAMCVVVYVMMEKWTPKLLGLLTGNRNS